MKKKLAKVSFILILHILFTIPISNSIQSYDKESGVEWGDRVSVSCYRYLDGDLLTYYSEEKPLEVSINSQEFNYNFVSKLVGMKKGETKASISWYVTQTNGTINFFEYKDVTIIEILIDSTPDNTGPSAGNILLVILKVMLGIAVTAVIIIIGFVAYKKLKMRKCASCNEKQATVKCAKCEKLYCNSCSGKGCENCKSKKFIRF